LVKRVSEIYFEGGVIYGVFGGVYKVLKLNERYICDQKATAVILNLKK
jgi:hypothetical protein